MADDPNVPPGARPAHAVPAEPPKAGGGAPIAAILAGLLILALLVWALWATFADDDESAGPEAGITLEQVADDADALEGTRVVVSGQIDDILNDEDAIAAGTAGATGFTLGEEGEVLIVGVDVATMAVLAENEEIAEGDVVQVGGVVHTFDEAAFEEDLGVDLDGGLFNPFDERPAIAATAINLVPVITTRGENVRLTLDTIDDDPREYLGQRVQVRDAEVDEVLSPRVVALTDDVVAILPENLAGQVSDGDTVQLDGTVVETSSARLLNELRLDTADDLFDELGIDEPEIAEYEVAIVTSRVTGGSGETPGAETSGTQTDELTAGGRSLLPVPTDGLESFVGQEVRGTNLLVQQVVPENGFFVGPEGTSLDGWVFVEFGDEIGPNEQGEIPAEGDRVDLVGPVSESTEGFANALELNAEQERAIEQQGAFINAELVDPAGE